MEAGMGARLLGAAVASGDRAEEIDGRAVAVEAKETVTGLRAWVGDRCELMVRAPTRAEAEALFEATRWEDLEALCEARDPEPPTANP